MGEETALARIESRLDRKTAGAIALNGGPTFRSMNDVMEFAKLMALGGIAVREHCRGNPGVCLAITMQAVEWGCTPFSVANKSYEIKGQLAFEAQLVHAVIEARAPLKGRLRCRYEGEGPDRVCIVWGTFNGENDPHEYRTPKFRDIPIKNSPLWKSDPDQQLWYFGSRSWARKWCSDVLLGIYTPEELTHMPTVGEHATPFQTIHNPLGGDDEDVAQDAAGKPGGALDDSAGAGQPSDADASPGASDVDGGARRLAPRVSEEERASRSQVLAEAKSGNGRKPAQ